MPEMERICNNARLIAITAQTNGRAVPAKKIIIRLQYWRKRNFPIVQNVVSMGNSYKKKKTVLCTLDQINAGLVSRRDFCICICICICIYIYTNIYIFVCC